MFKNKFLWHYFLEGLFHISVQLKNKSFIFFCKIIKHNILLVITDIG